jgi:hypothetical protein
MRYMTVAELKNACDEARTAGREVPELTLDNDDAPAHEGDECVFRMHPGEVLRQALDLLGIPWGEA